MLEAIPTNIFSTAFRLHQQNQLLGEIDTSIWREKATLELPDGTYELYREGTFNGDFVLEHNGKVVARAAKPSAFQSRFEVEVAGKVLELRKLSIWNRRFGVFDGETQEGGIYPVGFFTRRASVDLPDNWPLATRVFVFWLAFIMWRRQDSAAASS
jgi:endo-1,4-beta-mannosidase